MPVLGLRIAVVVAWFAVAAVAVEVDATIRFVPDGDTVVVAVPGWPEAETRVRLKWIDTPEGTDNPHDVKMAEADAARALARRLLPRGTAVRLWHPDAAFERDEQERVVALVSRRPDADGAWMPVQLELIAAGSTVYWRRFGEAPEPLHARFAAAMATARDAKAGAWATAGEWMARKADERPPRRRRRDD